ncbi:MAG: sigma-54-dependent Fis family transcriptional regulator [Proteobacteria bacterium]|nr:sigma-54-dependent Fis family transcriptional regulator [Pseudomonadota bacterium]
MILIVDDEAENRESLCELLTRQGWPCLQASSGSEALAILKDKQDIRLLITDFKMPGEINGIELMRITRQIRPDVQRLMVTAYGTIEDTVQAMKVGAFDVLAKPLKWKTLKEKIEEMLSRSVASTFAQAASPQISPSYARILELIRRASSSEASVLFTGESGTGKSYLSRILHSWSSRKEAPFISLNCAAIPAELLESELFGFEKGAFTGASHTREGKIMAADKGTLLLDEISDLSLPLQAKLLQFIQDKEFYKLGSNKSQKADVRILSASNQNIAQLIEEKKFREDLYYRLKVVEIHIPPIRERKEDLFWLIPALLDKLCERHHIAPLRFTKEAFRALWRWDWPGNIRELENVLEATLVLSSSQERQEGFLQAKSLPEHIQAFAEGEKENTTQPFHDLETREKQALEEALVIAGGNKKQAAALLGVSERTLYRLLGQ